MRNLSRRALIVATLSLLTRSPSRAADPPRPEELFRAAFATDYTVQIEQTTSAADAQGTSPLRNDSYAFKSGRWTTGPDGRTYLRFRLCVQEYAVETEAAAALRRLAGELTGDMFAKWPLLAFAAGPTLYRLDGSCLYAPEAWRVIEGRLLELFPPPPGGPPLPRLRIACGGAVQESPPPAKQP